PSPKSKHLLVVFSGFHGSEVQGKPPVYNYINTLESLNINKLFILDDVNNAPVYYYGTKGTDSYFQDTSKLVESYSKSLNIKKNNVITTGSSKGGTAALIIGLKIGAGHIISAANQLFVGSYLNQFSKVRSLLFTNIFGNNNDDNVQKLNDFFEEKILVNATSSNLYFHAGIRDSHYRKHMIPMLNHFDNMKIYYELDLRNYVGHNSVVYYFPEYLQRKMKEIINLPQVTTPTLIMDFNKLIIKVNSTVNRPKTHRFKVIIYLKDGKNYTSEFDRNTTHIFEDIEEVDLSHIKVILKEYEIIRDEEIFVYSELRKSTDIFNTQSLIHGEWIDFKGKIASNRKMLRTMQINYDSNVSYSIAGSGYVAYYKGDRFIKTKRYTGYKSQLPFNIDEVYDADRIIISFNSKWLGNMKLLTE